MRRNIILISLLALLKSVIGKGGLCEVETGQSNIIMDIEESRGTEIAQETSPVELPIRGDPFTEVQLELSFPKGHPLFILNGRKLQLLQPLDRDKDNLSHIVFQVTCTIRGTNKRRTIPVIVRVSDVNDNAPEFINTPYEVSISELSPVGTTVFTGLKATDPDAGANGLVEYRVVPGRVASGRSNERLAVADGSQYFAINLPHQGQVTVAKALDYERTQRYLLTVVASVRAICQPASPAPDMGTAGCIRGLLLLVCFVFCAGDDPGRESASLVPQGPPPAETVHSDIVKDGHVPEPDLIIGTNIEPLNPGTRESHLLKPNSGEGTVQNDVTPRPAGSDEHSQRNNIPKEPELIIGTDIEPSNFESHLNNSLVEAKDEKIIHKVKKPFIGPSEEHSLHASNANERSVIYNESMKNESVSEQRSSLTDINKSHHIAKGPVLIIGTDIDPPNFDPQELNINKPNTEGPKDEKKVTEPIIIPAVVQSPGNNSMHVLHKVSTISNNNNNNNNNNNATEDFISQKSRVVDFDKLNHISKDPEFIIGTDVEPLNSERLESQQYRPNVGESKNDIIFNQYPLPNRNNIINVSHEESTLPNERLKNATNESVLEKSNNFTYIIKKIARLVNDRDYYKVDHNDVIVNDKDTHEKNHFAEPQDPELIIGTEFKNVTDIPIDIHKLTDPHLIPFLDTSKFSEVSRANHKYDKNETWFDKSVINQKVHSKLFDAQDKKAHQTKNGVTEDPEIVIGTSIENSTNYDDTQLIKIPLNIHQKHMDDPLKKLTIIEGNGTINTSIKEVTEGEPKEIEIYEFPQTANNSISSLHPAQEFKTHSKPEHPLVKEPELVFGLDFVDLNHNGSDVSPEAKDERGNSSLGDDKVNKTVYGIHLHNSVHNSSFAKNKSSLIFASKSTLIRLLHDQADRARNQTSRMSSTTTLTVNVKDDDDQDPSFIYQGCVVLDGSCINPEYQTSVSSGMLAGVLTMHPEKIQAVDMDSLDTPIIYSFLSGSPDNFRDFFEIDSASGVVKQIRPVDFSVAKKFNIIVKAEEASEGRRFATAKLVITVKPVDASPPVLTTSAGEGFVQENSPVGTRILDANGKPIRLSVTDADLGPDDPKPTYDFELTTSFFHVDAEGYLVVNLEDLDRDPPSPGHFRFQVVAREKTGTAASSPIILSVVLTDVNDNAPRLPMIPPISVQAGEGHREIANVTATDNDLGENAIISYSIYHVSNNGRNKFQIDPQSGVIESVGKLNAGEQYSITVQATDSGGKYSQTIVEVNVIPGPNTRSPVFKENTYEVTVSEGAPINSSVITITALDPEKEPVTYSIIAGNDLRQFGINDKTGVISVRRKLDREDLTRYQLLIKAEDEGGLSSTATVNIHVSDINDKNPEFIGEPYDWKVREGLVGAHVGVVEATDADEGMNANITYSVPDEVPFTINPQTGTVMTSTSLDYEKQKEYKFVVTAKDGAMEPRLATATVTVSVVDVEDEMPIFHKPLYEATVPENTPDYFVTQVTADDPDTTKAITYVMRQGPTELFSVDRHDGTIRTLRGLDFESEPEYDLVIGTLENNTTHKGSTTTVRVRVTDVNDIPPVFLTTSGPVPLDDNVSIGTIVTTLMATDSDGTAPGNKIRYEIVGRGKAMKYFQIDPDLGTITVRDDLRKEADNEYQVDVKAYDLGEPQLSSVTSVPVFVRHVAVATPPIHLGFPDDSYTIQVPEDTKPGSLLKSFAVIASTSVQQIPLRCSIVQGNIDDLFFVNITGEKTCDLLLGNKQLDYEKRNEYQLKLKLDSLDDYINQNKSVTTVKIQVIDVNDNPPTFVYPSYTKLFKKDKYFGAVAKDKKEVRTVLQVKAEDKDSSGLTQLEYKLEPSEMNEYFSIDPSSGSIRTRRSVDSLAPDQLPVRLTVLVVDGKEVPNTATAQVVINVIDESDWLILPIGKVAPEAVSDKEIQISELLSQATGKLVGVERIGPLESTPDNITLNSDTTSTDLWLYFVDPETEKIIPINETLLAKTIKDEDVIANITAEVTTALGGGTLYPLHAPIKVRALRTAVVALDWEVFPYAVILIAGLILVLGTAGIVYICISWQRYKAYKERMQRMYVMPRYDPVFVEPNLKEYETQVLQMSVPMDDNDSYHDLQLDFSRKNHAFSLDNVSYITKDHGDNGGQSPTSSEAATTTRASSLGRHNNNNIHHDGAINLSYDRSDDEMGHNSSPTNENVTFREKKDYSHLGFNYLMDRSPIETTTEL